MLALKAALLASIFVISHLAACPPQSYLPNLMAGESLTILGNPPELDFYPVKRTWPEKQSSLI